MKIRWDVLGAEAPGGFKGTGAGLTLGRLGGSLHPERPRSDPQEHVRQVPRCFPSGRSALIPDSKAASLHHASCLDLLLGFKHGFSLTLTMYALTSSQDLMT